MATCRHLVALAGLSLLPWVAPVAAAQPALPDFCVAQQVSNPQEKYYKVRAEGAYCDGIIFVPHARKSGLLPVLAVATGVVDEPVPSETVAVLEPSAPTRAIRVQGVALNAGLNYRLDAELESGTRLRLGAESGLAHIEDLTLSSIGWLAWVERPVEGMRYLPALDPRLSPAEIEITVRPTIRSVYVVYSMYDAAGAELIGVLEAASGVDANTNVSFSIPGRGPSPVRINVKAIGTGKSREIANLWIERRGGAGEG